MKTIGILGGMGPAASAQLYQNIITHAQEQYGAVQDNEYPKVLLHSIALDGFDETGIVDVALVEQQLVTEVKKLEVAGAEVIVMACNTVHMLYEQVTAAVDVEVINLIQEVCDQVHTAGYTNVGVLSSHSSWQSGLYADEFLKLRIHAMLPKPEDQTAIDAAILAVMSGHVSVSVTNSLQAIAVSMIEGGAEAIVLGCTELPLAITQTDLPSVKVFDSLQIAAEVTLARAAN